MDLITARRVVFAVGPLIDAIYASVALPGVVPPLQADAYRFIDGGFGEPVPVEACRHLGAGHVIAVDVLGRPGLTPAIDTGLATVLRADQIARYALEQEHLQKADVVVAPAVEAVDWTDFSNLEQRIAEGERAASDRVGDIRELVSRFERAFVRGAIVTPACKPG